MFKVGDMVWLNDDKKYAKITKVDDITFSEKVAYDIEIKNDNYKGWRFDCQLHQTAQAMFEALGFALMNQSIKGANYLQTNDCEIYPYNKDDKIQIVFYKEVEGYVVRSPLSDINGDIVIKLELHLAIHQKMIELGWL